MVAKYNQRIHVTLPVETVSLLEQMVSEGKARSISKAAALLIEQALGVKNIENSIKQKGRKA